MKLKGKKYEAILSNSLHAYNKRQNLREGEWGGFLETLYPSNIHVDKKKTIKRIRRKEHKKDKIPWDIMRLGESWKNHKSNSLRNGWNKTIKLKII